MTFTRRRLHEREYQVLNALLGGASPTLERFRHQVHGLQVVGRCSCGCPTVEFATERPHGGGVRVVAEATVGGSHDSILLFATDQDELASLEYVGVGDTNPADFPEPARLVVAPQC